MIINNPSAGLEISLQDPGDQQIVNNSINLSMKNPSLIVILSSKLDVM
jgi:hypothetical protein